MCSIKNMGKCSCIGSIFGLIFAIICTYKGFNTSGGAAGVGEATNKGVVSSMVSIIVIDFFLTKLVRIFVKWT